MENKFQTYVATGGQSSRPFGQFKVPYPKWERLEMPKIDWPDIGMNPKYKDWVICIEGEHFLPGVTSEMIDWFWSNMEKGYYLWAPGSHKRFQWIREPWEYGFTNSKHTSLENMSEDQILDLQVAAGDGYGMLLYNRYDMDIFPFDFCLKPYIIVLIAVFILVALTSSPPAGLGIIIPIFITALIQQTGTLGIAAEATAVHRICSIAFLTFETLPWNGMIVVALGMANIKHKEGYLPMFLASVFFPVIAAIAAVILFIAFPGLA